MYIFLLIFLLIYIIFALVFYNSKNNLNIKEKFNNYLSFKTIQVKIPITFISAENNIVDNKFKSISNKIPYIKYTEDINSGNLNLINAYKFYIDELNLKVLTITNLPNICIFFANNNNINSVIDLIPKQNLEGKISTSTIFELNDIKENIKIGYLFDYEINIIKYILKSLDINTKIQYIKLNTFSSQSSNQDISNVIDNLFNTKNIDIFFYFNTVQYLLLDNILMKDYAIINYNNIDKDIIKNFIPFGRFKNILLQTKNTNLQNQANANLLLIDNLIYEKTISKIEDLQVDSETRYNNIINIFNTPKVLNNYYSTYFKFNKHNTSNIIENFLNRGLKNLTIDFNNYKIDEIPPAQGSSLSGEKQTIYYKINTIIDDNQIPFNENDILNITQKLEVPNNKLGKYYIIKVFDSGANYQRHNYSIISRYKLLYYIDTTDKLELNNSNSTIDRIKLNKVIDKLENDDLVFILGINKEGVYKYNPKTGEVSIRIINIIDNNFSGNYICFEDPTIEIQALCESDRNIDGTKKSIYTWDKMCEKDNECDFYLINKNEWAKKKGGCNNGYCELPLGIKRKSFKKYEINENSFPICYGCKGKEPKDCCKSQENNKDYMSPNYIFPDEILVGDKFIMKQ
jgi:hypothetical protein